MWVSEEALDWALGRLKTWADQPTPKRRFKQTVYRLLLLRQLGVAVGTAISLTTTDFKQHCEQYLLVSKDENNWNKTGGRKCYLVPFTMDYQIADSDSDWAINTMWTRLDTIEVKSYLSTKQTSGKQREFEFIAGFEDHFASKLADNPIPALPLALFLLRGIDFGNNEVSADHSAQFIIDRFLAEFKLLGMNKIDEIFDLSPSLPA